MGSFLLRLAPEVIEDTNEVAISVGFLGHSTPILADSPGFQLCLDNIPLTFNPCSQPLLRCRDLCVNGFTAESTLVVFTEDHDNTDQDEHASWNSG